MKKKSSLNVFAEHSIKIYLVTTWIVIKNSSIWTLFKITINMRIWFASISFFDICLLALFFVPSHFLAVAHTRTHSHARTTTFGLLSAHTHTFWLTSIHAPNSTQTYTHPLKHALTHDCTHSLTLSLSILHARTQLNRPKLAKSLTLKQTFSHF